jgi:pyruvate kinase
MERHTKIVATLGPATTDESIIKRLLKAGVNVVRLNFSHGNHEEHADRIAVVRKIADQLNLPVTLLQDLQGPKIRTGELKDGSVSLVEGQTLMLTTQPVVGDENRVAVDFTDLPESVHPGGRILLDDGNLELAVMQIGNNQVETKVIQGGLLKPHKGVNLPGAQLNVPCLTEKDKADLSFGLEHGIDAVAMSFIRLPSDVARVRNAILHLAPERKYIPIIAKLERPEALNNLDGIIETSDGVMVARGDLGVEMPPESVPIAQKQIITAANQYAKVVITATQMLDSMINNPRPTRAEASDVANAIFDGTDAVMLSGETATGKYPVQAVEMMNAIICQAEAHMDMWGHHHVDSLTTDHDDTYFMTLAARELAHDRNVSAIAVFTRSGRTALLMSKARPDVPILAFTPRQDTYLRLSLYWGVKPHLVPEVSTIDEMLKVVEKAMVTSTTIQPGQQVVVIGGFPVNAAAPTNMALLHTVEEQF